MATDVILHIAKLRRGFTADATDKVLLSATCSFVYRIYFIEVPSDTLLIFTESVDNLLVNADDNTPMS